MSNVSVASMTVTTPAKFEVLYARSFIRDLKGLKVAAADQVEQLVFGEGFVTQDLAALPEFRALPGSNIFYRFTWADHLLCIEVTGQIVKFVRVLVKPPV
jgi:hypothetical protein